MIYSLNMGTSNIFKKGSTNFNFEDKQKSKYILLVRHRCVFLLGFDRVNISSEA